MSKQSLQSGRSVLALSCRSTSVKAALVDEAGGALLLDELPLRGVQGPDLVAVGHRVVHGGDLYGMPVLADAAVEAAIADFGRFVPLHNPVALEGLRAASASTRCRVSLPSVMA
ncbi:MAG: hypothetical protein NTZ79_10150 [Proteobacteria bacterium]|nr:hypothetical protein [Pseudomonadota bacterium]